MSSHQSNRHRTDCALNESQGHGSSSRSVSSRSASPSLSLDRKQSKSPRSRRRRSRSYDAIKVGYPLHNSQSLSVTTVDHQYPHDRALVRAMNSDLKKTKNHQSDPVKTLFIGRLNSSTGEHSLRTHFERFGKIRSLHLIRDLISGESRRYAFIEYRHSKEADLAYKKAHNTLLDGRRILVDRELGRTLKNWKPRRFGGGFGGHKQSGQMRFGGRSGNRPGPRHDGQQSHSHQSKNHRLNFNKTFSRSSSNRDDHQHRSHDRHGGSTTIYSNGNVRRSIRRSGHHRR